MAKYYPVSPRFWADAKASGWNDNEKLLGLYLLTCEHRNLEGLYRLPLAYMADDLSWPGDRLASAFAGLQDRMFCAYDEPVQVVFVRNALKYQQPKTEKQIAGALAALSEVPDTHLFFDLIQVAKSHAPTFHESLSDAYAKHLNEEQEWHSEGIRMPPETTRTRTRTISSSNSNTVVDDAILKKLLEAFGDDHHYDDIETVAHRLHMREQLGGQPISDVFGWSNGFLKNLREARCVRDETSRPVQAVVDGVRLELAPESDEWVEVA